MRFGGLQTIGRTDVRIPRLRTRQTVTSDATADARTYTAAEVLGGIIVRDCAGSARSDVLPTAALLIAAMRSPVEVGDVVCCTIINGSDADEAITLGAGTGGSFDTNQVAASRIIPQNQARVAMIRITGVSTPAYVVYLA